MRLEEGQKVGGRYRLVRRLGAGGMADVWLAEDEMLDRRVALKFLHERFNADTQFVERFRREAKAAAGLQHPNLVGVYDRGTEDGRHWIAMEYVEGASLRDLIARGLSVPEAIEIVRQILAGVRYAHQHGIVHRDLKPGNVLVDAEGRARVTDFGIARAGASEITQTGSVLGTAQYLSPEQAQGLDVTQAADIYSIGVILYEALTGRVPFDGDSAVAVAMRQVTETPRPPAELNPAVGPALSSVVMRALEKDPERRFASADEFLRALDAAEADPALAAAAPLPPAPPPPEPPPKREFWTRRKLIALGVILALLIGVAAWALTRAEQVRVPAVVGFSQDRAERVLQEAGFEVAPRTFESCDEPQTVVEQDPAGGTNADAGSTVVIHVSIGSQVAVPNLAGMRVDRAAARLKDAQLQADQREVFSNRVEPGRVVRTEPPAGEQVACQSVVEMLVSQGANLVPVPDVVGLDEADAETAIRDARLIPNVETRDADEPEGTVIDQSPAPGTEIRPRSEVTIVVSTGAGSVEVPNVVGQPERTALNTLRERGVTNVEIRRQETDVRSEDGRVLDQAPSPGTRIRSGDRVTIFVGEYVAPATPPEDDVSADDAAGRPLAWRPR
ncbi:MAG TPA: PASTA domain-containing protein [Solirubrobacterales bacterium]|jgi:serine/threonine-protein kinase